MGLFSKTDLSDLQQVEDTVGQWAQQLALHGKGLAHPELLDERTQAASAEMRSARERLLAEGRQKDLKAL